MKNTTYVKYIRGEANELDKRILIRDVGYEIIVSAKGYKLEDKSGVGNTIDKTFETIDDITDFFKDKFNEEFGDSFTTEQRESLAFESKIQIITAGIIQDAPIFNTVRALAQETGSDYLPSYSEDVERDGFQVSVGFISELRALLKDDAYIEEIGVDKMQTLLQELLEAEIKSLSSIDVRLP